jgi:hypothetical protein
MDVSICVETSREWKGDKVVAELSGKIKTKVANPKFILLFSTIDYKDEFKQILSGMKSIFSDSAIVGGTLTGFMTPEGCYSRGVTALAFDSTEMDVALGVGRNTKRNPQKAAEECAKTIKEGLEKSKYKNGFLFVFIAGSEILQVPGVGRKTVIRSGALAKTIMKSFKTSQYVLQKGFGREEEILEEIVKTLPDFSLVGGSTVDNKMLRNYQFLNDEILTNSVVCLGIKTDLKFDLEFAHGGEESETKFRITKIDKSRQIIEEINGKPAVQEFLKIMKWPEEILDEKRWISIFPRFPLGFCKNKKIFLRPFTMILGDSIGFMSRIDEKDVFICYMSGPKMVKSVDDLLKEKNPRFGYFVSCAIRQMALGDKTYEEHKKLASYFKKNPFLLIYTAGEAVYDREKGLNCLNESTFSAIFRR